MKAVILAGGKGRRLRPYTTVLPKPLIPLGEVPIIEVVLRRLAAHGFDDVTMADEHPVFARPFDGYWLDIGRPDDYGRAVEETTRIREQLLARSSTTGQAGRQL